MTTKNNETKLTLKEKFANYRKDAKERYEEFYKRFCCYDDGNASKHIVEEVFK